MPDDPELEVDELEPEGEPEGEEPEDEPEGEEPEGEPEGEEPDGDPEPEPARARQPGRSERRITELARQNAELTRRLDEYVRTPPQRQQEETPEQREQRLALLTPEDRIREDLRASEQRHARDMQFLQFQTFDSADRSAFQAKAAVDPLYAKWAPKVEARLQEMRNHPDPRQRSNVPREALFYYLVGEAAIGGRKAATTRQRTEAGRRVANQRTRPGNSGSDARAERRQTTPLEKRLENVSI